MLYIIGLVRGRELYNGIVKHIPKRAKIKKSKTNSKDGYNKKQTEIIMYMAAAAETTGMHHCMWTENYLFYNK